MARQLHSFCRMVTITAIALAVFVSSSNFAQVARLSAADAGTDPNLGTLGAAGVIIDSQGVLRKKIFRDRSPALARQRIAAARAGLDRELAQPSKLRKVSITRLEQLLAERAKRGETATDDMRYLAGLTSIDYVFYYPETKDIVIAGPAEGYMRDISNRVVGIASGGATLSLEDLVVAMRAFPPSGQSTNVIGCSIDPTDEGLARMQRFLRSIMGRVRPGDANRIAAGLRESLGKQTVTINGVEPDTHFAQVLVEADYRMKLIGIGLERPPVRIQSYVSRANPASVARNALLRWYFVPNYECVRVSEDGMAMQLVGDRVKLVGQDEVVTDTGGRQASRGLDRAGQAYVKNFTDKYPELAHLSPVFGQLRNLIDMSIVAAYIQHADYYNQSGWDLGMLASESEFPVSLYTTPRQVESAVNVIWKGNTLMTPIGGGVNIQPRQALAASRLLEDENQNLHQVRQKVEGSGLPENRWWWD